MRLFKQLIKLKYQKFVENEMNKRFFFWDFYKSYTLASVVLKKPVNNVKYVYLQQLMSKYYSHYPRKAIQSMNYHNEDSIKRHKDILTKLREPLNQELNTMIIQDTKTINEFFYKYNDVDIDIDESKQFDGAGVISVLSNYYSYERM